MIITRLLGGLGNQMFQYAAGLALAQERRTVLKMDVSWFRDDPDHAGHNRYGLSCFNITEQFATEQEVDRVRGRALSRPERWLGSAARGLRLRRLDALHEAGGNWHTQKTLRPYPEFARTPDNSYIDGMWQSERFFSPAAAGLLRSHFSFRYPAPAVVSAMVGRIRAGPSAAVHIRRGDYVTNPQYEREIGVLSVGYYERAAKALRNTHPDVTLYVFSDDIGYAEKNFRPAGNCVYVPTSQAWHAYDDLRMMAQCDHFVIGNSTFGWWGAWLGENPQKLVIAPEPWLAARPAESSEIVPESWTRLSSGG